MSFTSRFGRSPSSKISDERGAKAHDDQPGRTITITIACPHFLPVTHTSPSTIMSCLSTPPSPSRGATSSRRLIFSSAPSRGDLLARLGGIELSDNPQSSVPASTLTPPVATLRAGPLPSVPGRVRPLAELVPGRSRPRAHPRAVSAPSFATPASTTPPGTIQADKVQPPTVHTRRQPVTGHHPGSVNLAPTLLESLRHAQTNIGDTEWGLQPSLDPEAPNPPSPAIIPQENPESLTESQTTKAGLRAERPTSLSSATYVTRMVPSLSYRVPSFTVHQDEEEERPALAIPWPIQQDFQEDDDDDEALEETTNNEKETSALRSRFTSFIVKETFPHMYAPPLQYGTILVSS